MIFCRKSIVYYFIFVNAAEFCYGFSFISCNYNSFPLVKRDKVLFRADYFYNIFYFSSCFSFSYLLSFISYYTSSRFSIFLDFSSIYLPIFFIEPWDVFIDGSGLYTSFFLKLLLLSFVYSSCVFFSYFTCLAIGSFCCCLSNLGS